MEATPEQSAEGLAIVRVLSAVLDRLVTANAAIAIADPGQVTKFHAMKAPGIAIEQYLERIHKYASCSNECFILALIYIDRLIQRSNFLLTELNVHRVVITAVLLAAKFFDDAYYNNAYYAKVGGVLVSEMNGLEVDFLFRINFSLHVTSELFDKYRAELLVHSNSVCVWPNGVTETSHSPVQVAQQPHIEAPLMTTAHYGHDVLVAACSWVTPTSSIETFSSMDDNPSFGGHGIVGLSGQGQHQHVPSNDPFVPLMRANSLPVATPFYVAVPRCTPNPLGPAPMIVTKIPFVDNPFLVAVENQMYHPIQSGIIHHHHGVGFQQTASDAAAYNVGRMLTGVSGAGI